MKCDSCGDLVAITVGLVHRPPHGKPVGWSLCVSCFAPEPVATMADVKARKK